MALPCDNSLASISNPSFISLDFNLIRTLQRLAGEIFKKFQFSLQYPICFGSDQQMRL